LRHGQNFEFLLFFIRHLSSGIPPSVDRDELKTIFEQFGAVVDAIVMIDQVTNRSRCFGFVTFENGSNGAHRAIAVQPLNIQGRSVEVKLATPKAEQKRLPPAAGPRNVGLRAGMSSSTSSGEYAGLAVAYGRSGWKAGYGTKAFGKAGWAVQGWEDEGGAHEKSGFSFAMLQERQKEYENEDAQQQQQKANHSHPHHDQNHQGEENWDGPRSKRSRH
jgi:RNA recognition motif-containing protein